MKSLLVIAISIFSIAAQADLTCETVRIQQWPHNPEVKVAATNRPDTFQVTIVRPNYGYLGSEKFEAVAQHGSAGSMILASEITAFEINIQSPNRRGEFKATLVSETKGTQTLLCKQE